MRCLHRIILATIAICASLVQVVAADSDQSADVPSDTTVARVKREVVIAALPHDHVDLSLSMGLSLTILPQPLTEYPTPAPMLDSRFKLELPLRLAAYGRVASNVATSIGQLGGMFSIPIHRLTIAPGYSVAYTYGYLTYVDGFNTTQERWINYPSLTVSWTFPRATLSARIEAELQTSIRSWIEDQQTGGDKDLLTGALVTIALEQPFFANTHVCLGVTFQSSSNPYQAWFLYSTYKDRLFSSEFFIGLLL